MIEKFEPKWIAWEITRRCNLKCVHCRSSSQAEVKGHPDFSMEEARRVLDDIASYASPVVVLSGGEPLLREDVFEIARYGTDKGLRMCIATNGTLVTDEICGKIKASGIRIASLSLDGSTAEIHDDFRNQKGAFEGTLRAAGLFRKHGIEFIINSSFTSRNQEDIPNIYRLAKSLGATAWYMFMIVPTGRGDELMKELISAEDYEALLDWHYEMEKDEDTLLVRPTCAPHYYRVVLQKNKERAGDEKLRRRTLKFSTGGSKGCLAGQLICLIDVDGNVQPCSYFPMSAGNIRRQAFGEIWENSKLFKDMRDFRSYKGRCGSCEFVNVCGGCRARAYAVHGDYMAEEPFCSYVPAKIRKAAGGGDDKKTEGAASPVTEEPMNDTFLKACRGEKVPYTPVWVMRQAGRYMSEYREVRAQAGDFLNLCKTPELAAKVTMQPVDMLGVDAAILFSDILVTVEAMGMKLEFHEKQGPVLENPIRTRKQLDSLIVPVPEDDLGYVMETIRILRKRLNVPLIGFSGAPFTLATYMVEGGSSKNFLNTKRMMYEQPALYHDLMDKITDSVQLYLAAQIRAGAQAVQIFDSWVGVLDPHDFRKYEMPYVKRIVSALKKEFPNVPVIYFANNCAAILKEVRKVGADVVGIDWRIDMSDAVDVLGPDAVVQGNLDPLGLFLPEEALGARVKDILAKAAGAGGHIFNLGHGVLPETDVEHVKAMVRFVHELSAGMKRPSRQKKSSAKAPARKKAKKKAATIKKAAKKAASVKTASKKAVKKKATSKTVKKKTAQKAVKKTVRNKTAKKKAAKKAVKKTAKRASGKKR